jgi:5-methylthioadenosine/S-adenosylhomocysteine deaminase
LISVDLIIKNGIIVTVNSQRDVYRNGFLAIKGDKIVKVGKISELEGKYSAKETIDAKGKIIMPGLVNTHNHLAMTVFRGFADDLHLLDWLNKHIFPAEAKFITSEVVRLGSEMAMIEMLQSGTTTFNDMYFFSEEVAEAALKIGMRGIISESFADFPVPNCPTPNHTEAYIRKLVEKYKNSDLIDVGIAVHSPYTCQPELIQRGMKIADEFKLNYHIHVAETKWEFDKIKSEKGMTPVQYLDELGVIKQNTVSAHSVWLTDEDIQIMTDRQAGVAHNPECNMKLSSGIAPIPKMLEAGVKVGLGTDGTASNNNLNMFEELRTMTLLHKLNSGDPTVIPAKQAIQIATLGGAKVIGKDKEIGSFETGKKADIILIDITKSNTTPLYEVYSSLVYSINAKDVTDVIINGKQIIRNSILLTIDEEEVKYKVNDLSKNIYNKTKN